MHQIYDVWVYIYMSDMGQNAQLLWGKTPT